MAGSPYKISTGLLGLGIVALTLGSAAIAAWHAGGGEIVAADLAALRFTLVQAAWSAGISCGVAVPLARALARRRFAGRALLIRLLAAPFLLPVIVAVLGILAVFGRQGPVNQLLLTFGLPSFSIFGLHGVVLAHVFLNLPLAARMVLLGWQSIPAERFLVARALGMDSPAQFRHLELPMLGAVLPGAIATVFLLCLTSFAVALLLGGGPAASTLELSIYQALRFEFDPGHAAMLAMLQFGLCATVTLAALQIRRSMQFGAGLGRDQQVPAPLGWRNGIDVAMIGLAGVFLLGPVLALIARGIPGLWDLPASLPGAIFRSLVLAIASAVLAAAVALTLAQAVVRGARWLELVAMLPLTASGLVIGTGLFLAVRPVFSPETLALPLTFLVNALLAVPFVFRLLLPEAQSLQTDYGRLTGSLGLKGMARLRLVTLPRLARPLGFGAGLAAALSMGDLGVIALFAGERGVTLPLLVQRLMGAYRMEAAAGVSLVLIVCSFALFWIFDRLGARHAAA